MYNRRQGGRDPLLQHRAPPCTQRQKEKWGSRRVERGMTRPGPQNVRHRKNQGMNVRTYLLAVLMRDISCRKVWAQTTCGNGEEQSSTKPSTSKVANTKRLPRDWKGKSTFAKEPKAGIFRDLHVVSNVKKHTNQPSTRKLSV